MFILFESVGVLFEGFVSLWVSLKDIVCDKKRLMLSGVTKIFANDKTLHKNFH